MKIDRIDVYPLEYPTVGFFKFFSTPRGATGRPAVMLKVTADDGTVGWGQTVPVSTWCYETLETSTVVLREYFAPSLVGHDALDIEGAHAAMDRAIRPAFSTGMPLTRAAVDLALHDLAGKVANKPLAEMWGLSGRGTVELSWTVNVQRLDDVASTIAAGRERGYRHFNIKVAPDPEFDRELARLTRQVAPDGFLWADANGGYDVETALRAAPMLAEQGVAVLESPLPANRIRGYQALKRQGALPILMDEGVVSPVELEEFIQLNMLDGVAMKPARCGGLSSCRRQIEICREHGLMWLGSGLCDPDVSLAASLVLYDAFGVQRPAALNGPQFLDASVLTTPVEVEGAQARVPRGPGLGVEVDEQKLKAMSADTARRWHLEVESETA